MKYRLRVARRAGRHIRDAAAWWLQHRNKAPFAFADDLDDALAVIGDLPYAGEQVRHPGIAGMRRILLTRTGYHLYYTADDQSKTVEILALWHSSRGEAPQL